MGLPALKLPPLPQASKPRGKVGRPPILSVQERKDRQLAVTERRQAYREQKAANTAREIEQRSALLAELTRLANAAEVIAAALAASGIANVANLTRKKPGV
jgi:hypothetical protein